MPGPGLGTRASPRRTNGALLPVTLFFVWRLSANRELMGQYANGRTFNVFAGATVLTTSGLSALLVVATCAGLL